MKNAEVRQELQKTGAARPTVVSINKAQANSHEDPLGPTVDERLSAGRALRERVPRTSHAKWTPSPHRPEPVALLRESNRGRLSELLPIRYGRMRVSPFAFFRGAAALMAWDLAATPVTKIRVQACGDCHLLNFGGYGSPERRLVFDINDFDETLAAPWEWDVKRLAASVVLAGRQKGIKERRCNDAARALVASYRTHMREYARMPYLAAWYSHIDVELFIAKAKTARDRKYWKQVEHAAKMQTAEYILPKITEVSKGKRRIIDHPPLVYHPRDIARINEHVRALFHRYRLTLPEERRVILDRYHIVDIARKVVGVGSVGTRCDVALLMAGDDDALVLQLKEALPSVLEAHAGKSHFPNHGERVVTGQRMLQAASDVFLGWTHADDGRDYYFRQLRDMKMKFDLESMTKSEWLEYVLICGWTLARAHARTGDAARIGGYMGKNATFDDAIGEFAVAYADQTERDHAALLKAIRAGQVRAAETSAA
jgi:uncharacterized protein (DUF2252 family)